MWRVSVDSSCIGSGVCVGVAPEYFALGEDERSHPVRDEIAPSELVLDAAFPVWFDWPGLGFSAPVTGAAHPYVLADHLLAVLDAAGLGRVDLLAADMGAPAALVFAARYPERVGAVTCTSALLFGDSSTSLEIRVMRSTGFPRRAFALAPGLVYARCKQSMRCSRRSEFPTSRTFHRWIRSVAL